VAYKNGYGGVSEINSMVVNRLSKHIMLNLSKLFSHAAPT
jgi:hypothetical protein